MNSPREDALVAIAEEFIRRCEAGTILSRATYRKMREALALSGSPTVAPYPGSDLGLAQMCPGVPLATLRAIQEAAFRAGREDMFKAHIAGAPPADARDALSRLASWLGVGMGDDSTTVAAYESRIRDGVEMHERAATAIWRDKHEAACNTIGQLQRERAVLTAQIRAGAPPALVALVQEWQAAYEACSEQWGARWVTGRASIPQTDTERAVILRADAAVAALLAWSPAPAPVAGVVFSGSRNTSAVRSCDQAQGRPEKDAEDDPACPGSPRLSVASPSPAPVAPPADELSASEALFAFGGWLTVRDEPLTLSARHDAAPMVERIGEFCKAYGLAPPRDGWDQKVRKMPGGFTVAPPAVAGGDAPEIQVGDVVLTERGRLFKVDLIQPRPAHCSPESWQGARFQYHGDEESGAVALDVAIVAVYRDPLWRRRQEGQR